MRPLEFLAEVSKASQESFELWMMLECVSFIEPEVIVEIGVHKGDSLNTWNDALSPNILIGIDSDPHPDLEVPTRAVVLEADSNDPATVKLLKNKLKGNPIDFLFIDGDHTYEGAKKDWQLYSPLVRKGGIVGFHDTNNRGIEGIEVDRVLAEIDSAYSYHSAEFRAGKETPGTRLIWL